MYGIQAAMYSQLYHIHILGVVHTILPYCMYIHVNIPLVNIYIYQIYQLPRCVYITTISNMMCVAHSILLNMQCVALSTAYNILSIANNIVFNIMVHVAHSVVYTM